MFLQRLPLVCTELLVTEESLQVCMYIQETVAVFAVWLLTMPLSQKAYDVFHSRIVAKYPAWSDRPLINRIYQCQSVC